MEPAECVIITIWVRMRRRQHSIITFNHETIIWLAACLSHSFPDVGCDAVVLFAERKEAKKDKIWPFVCPPIKTTWKKHFKKSTA